MNNLGLRLKIATARATVSPSASGLKSRWDIRRLHQRQPLPYPVEGGLGNFLPPEALNVQLEFQDGLLQRLNDEIAGTAEAGNSIAQTVISLSGKQDKILAFSYASLALNNSFFLNNLKPPSKDKPNHEHEISLTLNGSIRLAHGNIEQLRSAFSAAALGTFINGWIWFVTDQAGTTGIVSTYGAGTLLIRSRSNMEHHPNTPRTTTDPLSQPPHSPIAQPPPPGTSPASPLSGIPGHSPPPTPNSSHPRFYQTDVASHIMTPALGIHSPHGGTNERAKGTNMLNAGEILYPLFCIPVYEHAWMSAGYGVWGKEKWLKEFWSVLNWQKIDAAYMAVHNAINKKKKSS